MSLKNIDERPVSALQRAVQVAELPSGSPGAQSAFPKQGSLSPSSASTPYLALAKKERGKNSFQW